jgi:hypothetical protein
MCRYQGRRRRAIEVLREAEKIPPITSDDLVLSRLCRKMLTPLLRADTRYQKRQGRQPGPPATSAAVSQPADSISQKLK